MAAQTSKPMGDRQSMENLRDAGAEAKSTLQDMGSQAKQMAQEQFEGLRDTMSTYYEQGRERAMELEHSLESRIREKPVTSLLVAAGLGFVIGMLATRK